jgi:hypothetical protein
MSKQLICLYFVNFDRAVLTEKSLYLKRNSLADSAKGVQLLQYVEHPSR